MQTALNALTAGFSPDEPGVIVMVRTDNGATWHSCRGMADVATRTPVTPETIFNLASVSKQFAAFSLLLLVQEGKISLSDSVLSVLPELGEYARPVTLRHLLHHTSGLKDYMDLAFARKVGFYDPLTPQETLADLVSQTEADFPPGTRHDYSNTGYFLLSQIIERVSGQSFADFARERIFAPLAMDKTFIVEQYPAPQIIATGYGKTAGQWRISESPWTHTGDGAVHSCAADLMKWGENYRTARVGGSALIQQMTETLSPQTENGTPVTDYEPYAAGLYTLQHFGELSLEHAGGWMGTSTYFIRLTKSDTTIVVLSNSEECDTETLARAAAAAFLSPAFPAVITDHWDAEYRRGEVLAESALWRLMCRTDLETGYDALWLRQPGHNRIHISAELAQQLALTPEQPVSRDEFISLAEQAGLRWQYADQFFYLTEAAEAAQKDAVIPGNVRMLTEADRDIFAQFCARNNDDDADIAGVELTHPRVTGVFAEGQLVAAASACRWEDSLLQDIGVLTDPRYRRQGFARQALLALNRVILEAGLKPQYRCQTDNISSLILAQQSGFTPFAQWDFLLSEDEEE